MTVYVHIQLLTLKHCWSIDAGVQAILRFCLRNLRAYDVGVTDGRDL
jgi:hypothetical protein